ncbi:MAG: STAS domain-containing protein [Lentisphaeria bacterium]|nr:STAS domain-containing protein [Lentisphaeria bacterium]
MKAEDLKITAMDKGYLIEVSGRANFDYAVPLRELAEKLVPGNWIQFDMEYCETMDSTFMGVLTMLALKLRKSNSPQIMLINASAQLNKLLRDLGVAKLFKFVSGGENAAAGTGSVVEFSGRNTLLDTAQTVVDAHKTLVEADSSNAEKFNQVIEFAEQDVQRLKEDK